MVVLLRNELVNLVGIFNYLKGRDKSETFKSGSTNEGKLYGMKISKERMLIINKRKSINHQL